MAVIIKVWFLDAYDGLSSWALPVIFFSDECHGRPLVISQHWFTKWRHQVITRANFGPVLCHNMTSLLYTNVYVLQIKNDDVDRTLIKKGPNSQLPYLTQYETNVWLFSCSQTRYSHVETIAGSLIPLLQYYVQQFPPLLPHSIYVIGVGLNPANDEY